MSSEDEGQKYFDLLLENLDNIYQDVRACESSLDTKNEIYKQFNYFRNLDLKDLKYDEKKLMQYQIVSHEIKILSEKSNL